MPLRRDIVANSGICIESVFDVIGQPLSGNISRLSVRLQAASAGTDSAVFRIINCQPYLCSSNSGGGFLGCASCVTLALASVFIASGLTCQMTELRPQLYENSPLMRRTTQNQSERSSVLAPHVFIICHQPRVRESALAPWVDIRLDSPTIMFDSHTSCSYTVM